MVSIIVPVYNVENYIDRCMQSLIKQTYKNIEIILINDGSTDGSAEKCLKWSQKDNRIIFVNKKNEKQGPSRNLGILISKGNYIMFVDSDDYVKETMVESMYNCIKKSDADIVFSDYYELYDCENSENKTNISIVRTPLLLDEPINIFDDKNIVNKMPLVLVNKIYKKSLFIDNNLKMSEYVGQDAEIMPKLLLKAKKIFQIKEAYYYYCRDRAEQVTNIRKKTGNLSDCKMVLKNLNNYFIEEGYFNEFYEQLKKYSIDLSYYMVQIAKSNFGIDKVDEVEKEYQEMLNEYFPDWNDHKKLLLWGNYNTMVTIDRVNKNYGVSLTRFSSSSLISQFSESLNINSEEIQIKNKVRKDMVLNDLNKELKNNYKDIFSKINYILIDFIEERYDIIKYKDTYITATEAFFDTYQSKTWDYEIIKRTDSKLIEVFEKNCLEFIKILKENFEAEKIILIEENLMENYGTYSPEEKFKNSNEIAEINNVINNCYNYFKENFKGIHIIRFDNKKYLFSNKEHKYGCCPSHFNSYYYTELSDKISKLLNCI